MRKSCMSLVVCLMALFMSVTAFAAEQPQTIIKADDNGASITIKDITPGEEVTDEQKEILVTENFKVGSSYPVEIQTAEDNGYRLLVKTFIVPQGTDPQTLIEEGLTRRGVEYQVCDVLRRELDGSTETKTVSETVTMPTESDKKSDLIALFEPEMTYGEDGYTGTLDLNVHSITAEATDTEGYSYSIKDVKEFAGLERNDPYYIPKTAEKYGVTLQLAGIEWTPMASRSDNSDTPSLFKATATYTGTAWGSKASGFLATATYSGEVTKTTAGELVYSIVYEEVPPAGKENKSALLDNINWALILLCIFIIILILLILYLSYDLFCAYRERMDRNKTEQYQSDPYADRPAMDLPDMLNEMDRGLEDDK